MDHDNPNGDDVDTAHPWLVIPYFNGDEGLNSQRPLSKVAPPVTSWLCPSIHVQGVNYSTSPGTYLPNEPLRITVDVDNRGVPNALAKVQVYWSDPATGFASPQLIATASQAVPGRAVTGPTRFPPMVWTPDQTRIPEHFCLLVHVSCTPPEFDPGVLVPSPMTDRHWAQYNLQSAMVTSAGSGNFLFWAGNPALEQGTFLVEARPLGKDALHNLARIVRAEPVSAKASQLTLHRAIEPRAPDRETSMVLELERAQRQALVLSAHDLDLAPQQFTAIEVMQTRLGHERDGTATGSLGVVLFGHPAALCLKSRR